MSAGIVRKAFLILVLLLFSTGCSSLVKDGQPTVSKTEFVLNSGQSFGQTFVARDAGLAGVEVFLAPDIPGDGEIRVSLRSGAQSAQDLASVGLPVRAVTAPGFYRFAFAPQSNSRQQNYYLSLDVVGTGMLRVGSAPGDSYLDGALYQDGTPRDGQMVFRLTYEPVGLLVGLATLAGTWVLLLGIALFLFVLPGWALLALLLPGWKLLSWGERLGLAGSVSLAIYPLLFLWTDLVGLHLGWLYAWAPAVIAVIVLLWHNRAWRPAEAWQAWRPSGWVLPDLALALLIPLVFLVRFWVIRSLDAPLWGDSYQHTVITQLLIDHAGLFNSWQPYADMLTFTYHFGFHSAAAVFHWVSGMDAAQSVLWTGQILNGLAALALYPLAVRVGKNRWAGVVAVLVAGLVSSMPMLYVNWGRYTQLAGQVVLPGAIFLAWLALDSPVRNWKLIGLSWIVFAGLALAHYRILIFAILFFVAYFLLSINRAHLRAQVINLFQLGIGGAVLFLPWFIHTFAGKITLGFATQLTTPAEAVSSFMQQYNGMGDVALFLPIGLWLIFLVCVGWGFLRRDKSVAIIALWWFLILLSANPQWLRLPGEGAINNFTALIAAYIPAGIVVGAGVGWLSAGSSRKIVMLSLLALIVGIGLWSARQRLSDLSVESALVTRPDENAAAWIRENTSPTARFLVNSFFAYGDTTAVGSDGGWWLPLLARRQTMLPPINYAMENGPRSDYGPWVNALPAEIQKKGIADPEVLALLNERGITHVYIGQRQGRMNYNGPNMLLPEQLLADSHFRPVYHQDLVWVFQIVQ